MSGKKDESRAFGHVIKKSISSYSVRWRMRSSAYNNGGGGKVEPPRSRSLQGQPPHAHARSAHSCVTSSRSLSTIRRSQFVFCNLSTDIFNRCSESTKRKRKPLGETCLRLRWPKTPLCSVWNANAIPTVFNGRILPHLCSCEQLCRVLKSTCFTWVNESSWYSAWTTDFRSSEARKFSVL